MGKNKKEKEKKKYMGPKCINLSSGFLNLEHQWNVWHQKYEDKKEGLWNYLKHSCIRIQGIEPRIRYFLPKLDPHPCLQTNSECTHAHWRRLLLKWNYRGPWYVKVGLFCVEPYRYQSWLINKMVSLVRVAFRWDMLLMFLQFYREEFTPLQAK